MIRVPVEVRLKRRVDDRKKLVADRLAEERARAERLAAKRAEKKAAKQAAREQAQKERGRRKRGVRDKTRDTFVDTPGKRQVLVLLAQYRYLRTTSLIALLPHRHPQGLRDTLRRLLDEGLVEIPNEAFRGYSSLYTPNIYMLTEKGVRYLTERGLKPHQITRLYRQVTDAPVKNFAHAMMTCDALSSIHAGTIDTPVTFIPWTEIVARTTAPKPMKLPFKASHDGQYIQSAIVPDGLFGLRYSNEQVSFFALEAEHFNPIEPTRDLGRASTLKKLLAYRHIVSTKVFQHQLAIPNLRVLFVFPSKSRSEKARELATRLFSSTNLFLFTDIPVQEDLIKAPPPMPELLTRPLDRAGLESVPLYRKE